MSVNRLSEDRIRRIAGVSDAGEPVEVVVTDDGFINVFDTALPPLGSAVASGSVPVVIAPDGPTLKTEIQVDGAPVSGTNPLSVVVDGGVTIEGGVTVNLEGVATTAKQDALAAIVGEVQVSPTTNTVLDRLKTLFTAIDDLADRVGEINESPTYNTLLDRVKVVSSGISTLTTNVGRGSGVLDLTLSLDTAAYATGDVLAATQELASAVPSNGGHALLHSIVVTDKDDQGQAMDIVFMRTNVSLGTENAAVSIADNDADEILGIVPVAAADFIDLGGVRVATIPGIGLTLEAGASSTSIYVGAISRGAGTYTASGVTVRVGLAQQDY
jgi:hypothetical protein